MPTAAPTAATPPVAIPSASTPGAALLALLRWQLARIGPLLPVVVVIQVMLSAGLIVGFGFLIPDIDAETARYLSTGAPTMLLLLIGLVIVPGSVGQARTDGTLAYLRALPVPRPLLLVAELVIWTLIALPSVVVAVLVAMWRFDLALSFDWPLLVGVALLVTVSGAALGYMIAVVLPPLLAQVVAQAISFVLILFSPVSFPASQLPGWFQAVHDVLPIRPAADLLRAGLASEAYAASGRDLVVLVVWCAVGLVLSLRTLVART